MKEADLIESFSSTEPQGWVDMEKKVHAVYVNNLPLDITMDEFKEFMSKCGVIQPDARTNKPKLKLYVDENGDLKGDGRCVYTKKVGWLFKCPTTDVCQL